ncbi:MAG TPA: hypothetical protein VGC16_03245, partial [Rhizomicrobium sp.]
MAFTHSNVNTAAFDPARDRMRQAGAQQNPVPYDALARLPQLRDEARSHLVLGGVLARSSQACIALMLAAAATLACAGGASLKADFGWAALLLIGIVAMTRNVIRGHARSLRRVPLQEAVSDLRVLLLYTGMAWGSGALLVMPDLPSPALVFAFAAGPGLALALILRDEKGVIAFALPVTLATATAAVLGAWPLDTIVAIAVLAA